MIKFDRLERLRDKLLEQGPYEGVKLTRDLKFSLGHWYCGTSACAIGHAAVDPWFRRRGISLEFTGLEPYPVYRHLGKEYDDIEAPEEFFGITYDQADWLFMPSRYPNQHARARTVGKRIDNMIKAERQAAARSAQK